MLFAAVMLFIFGQSNRVARRQQGLRQASCPVSNVLLGFLSLPGWKLDGVVQATVESHCNVAVFIQGIVLIAQLARPRFSSRSTAGGVCR